MTAPQLSDLTTLGVGGPADRVVEATTTDGLVERARDVWATGDDWLVVGGGSNLLVADDGFAGTVLLVRTSGVEPVDTAAPGGTTIGGATSSGGASAPDDGRQLVRVAAGESWDGFVATTVARGWTGIEALSGIPGTVGASPVQNIGAYGVELADVLSAIEFLDAESGERSWVPAADLDLGYRTSALKRGRRGVVLTVEFALGTVPDDGVPVRYAQLAGSLGVPLGTPVPPAAVRDEVLRLRAAKGMVLDADDPDTRSAGSFFTNPIVSAAFADTLPTDAPRWPVASEPAAPEPVAVAVPLADVVAGAPVRAPEPRTDDRVKLSAAWLIEHAGVHRGYAVPGSRAAISSKHTLALTNRGGASAAEVAELARYVQTTVLSRFGVALVPEPVAVGDFA